MLGTCTMTTVHAKWKRYMYSGNNEKLSLETILLSSTTWIVQKGGHPRQVSLYNVKVEIGSIGYLRTKNVG